MWSTLFVRRVTVVTCFLFLFLVACAPEIESGDRDRDAAFTPTTVPSRVTPVTVTASPTPVPPTSTPAVRPTRTATAVPPTATSDIPIVERSPTLAYAFRTLTLYSGPGTEYSQIGSVEAGATVEVLAGSANNWLQLECPDGSSGSCWVPFDPNAFYRYQYEGTPTPFATPDPSGLTIVSTNTSTSPNGRWLAESIQSEWVYFTEGGEPYFYTALTVTARDDGTTWTPVSEWHAAGLGEESPPKIFRWSNDSRFVYYTSIAYPDGACVFYNNIGGYLDRLDVIDGSVAALQPPRAGGILAISPDDQLLAYLGGDGLVVRDLATAYDDGGGTDQDSVKWQLPLDVVGPGQVSEITWTPDSMQVLVTVTQLADDGCQLAGRSTWKVDVETGAFTPIVCPPEATGDVARETFLIFCGGLDHVSVAHNDSLIIDGAMTAEAYVNYFGGGGYAPRVIEIIDTFNISYSENKVWFCLFSESFSTNQGSGRHCLSHPQPELNRWVHLAGSWDGEKMYLFIDGELKAEMVFLGPLFHGGPGDQSLKIGNDWTLYYGFNGLIDEVRLSSIGRYQANFEPQSQLTADEYTVGLWHFDEGQGTAAVDASSHGNHGVLSPSVKWGSQP